MSSTVPRQGRLAGVDYGTVRIGLAISDPSQILASPLVTRERQTDKEDAAFFQQLARDEAIVGWIVGLPVHTSGEESEKSREARAFAAWLAEASELPVALFDERFTSQEADAVLRQGALTRNKKKQRRDQIAAQILLRAYLESSRDEGNASATPLDDD